MLIIKQQHVDNFINVNLDENLDVFWQVAIALAGLRDETLSEKNSLRSV